jgi:hypothetical protein
MSLSLTEAARKRHILIARASPRAARQGAAARCTAGRKRRPEGRVRSEPALAALATGGQSRRATFYVMTHQPARTGCGDHQFWRSCRPDLQGR